jgi:signal transduction histidine kinase
MCFLLLASIYYVLFPPERGNLTTEGLLGNLLMALVVVLPNYKSVKASIIFWLVLSASLFTYGFLEIDLPDSFFYAAIGEEKKLSYLIGYTYSLVSLGTILTVSHYSRLEHQELFDNETKTKVVLDRLNKMIAHNMRSPLATLQLQLEMDELKGLNVDRYKTALQSLLNVSEDLLTFNADAATTTANELCKFIAKSYNEVSIETHFKNNFDIQEGRVVYCGLQNFISNARKHTNGAIKVELYGDRGGWLISVVDDGVGMSEKVLSDLGKDLKSKTGGLGIGLRLTAELASMNGLSLVYQSRLGLGTRVYFANDCNLLEPHLLENWPTTIVTCSKRPSGFIESSSLFVNKVDARHYN